MATLSGLFGSGSLIPIEVFAVGGGGGGSFLSPLSYGNGGGAGTVLYSTTYATVGKPYTISIGGGGAGGPAPGGGPGLPGSDTSFGGTTIAYGGSGADILFGSNNVPTTINFGSVGGGTGPLAFDVQYTISDPSSPPFSPAPITITSYRSTFLGNSLGFTATPTGFVARNGWSSRTATGTNYQSGGGGAGSPGEFTVPAPPASPVGPGNAIAGRGGYGVSGSVVGLTTTYGGGGGAGVNVVFFSPGTFALGQAGRDGGGGGGYNFPTPALANRGGGGGGGGYFQQSFPTPFIQTVAGGSGGSGFLFIRYPTAYSAATVVGNAPTTAQPGYNVYAWTSGPGSITFN